MKSVCRAPSARHARHVVRAATCASCSSAPRPFSVLNRPPPNYPGHVPLTTIERASLAIGSGLMSLVDPRRGVFPNNTVGRATSAADREGGVPPNTARPRGMTTRVRYVRLPSWQPLRECHDFYHALTGLPVYREGGGGAQGFRIYEHHDPHDRASLLRATSP
ncbi:COQ4 [Verticillium alfalfae VaMs.102]|uniref:COQ4 n=1 Tax=Verticillium alfalfae (strain VaMs.102 / ATCC MYA-4576 / FGSC 10136) TaxID=526221 RepID=C9SC34_VERA1|nr:COQ4 [Verticillium alfalfae VaMs.102]EEY15918.1 COQ4 [Verticillium alfalfae VaMs.102]